VFFLDGELLVAPVRIEYLSAAFIKKKPHCEGFAGGHLVQGQQQFRAAKLALV